MHRPFARTRAVRASVSVALGAVLLLASLASCRSEPDFDDRYSEAELKIRSKAQEIDAELGQETARNRLNDVENVPKDDGT